MNTIFGNRNSQSTSVPAMPILEGYGVEVNGDLIALQEAYEDQLNVVKAIHEHDIEEISLESDLRVLRESGADQSEIDTRAQEFEAVAENMVKNAWDKLKELFGRLLAKLKAFFKSVERFFDGLFKSSQDFVKKYETQLNKADLRGFEYKMFDYDDTQLTNFHGDSDPKTKAQALLSGLENDITNVNKHADLKATIEKIRDDKEADLSAYRGEVASAGKTLTDEQFKEALYAKFRGGATSHEDQKEVKVDIKEVIAAIKNTQAKKKIEEVSKKTETEYSRLIKLIGDMERKVEGLKANDKDQYEYRFAEPKPSASGKSHSIGANFNKDGRQIALDALHVYAGVYSSQKEIMAAGFRAWREAWVERDRTYKSVCIAALRYKNKDGVR